MNRSVRAERPPRRGNEHIRHNRRSLRFTHFKSTNQSFFVKFFFFLLLFFTGREGHIGWLSLTEGQEKEKREKKKMNLLKCTWLSICLSTVLHNTPLGIQHPIKNICIQRKVVLVSSVIILYLWLLFNLLVCLKKKLNVNLFVVQRFKIFKGNFWVVKSESAGHEQETNLGYLYSLLYHWVDVLSAAGRNLTMDLIYQLQTF